MMEDDQLSEGRGDFGRGKRNRTAKQKFQKVSSPPSDVHYNKGIAKKERDRQTHELTGKRGKVRVRVYTA